MHRDSMEMERMENSTKPQERGVCALCQSIIYTDDSGAVVRNGALFCTVSCADEAETEYILDGGEIREV